MVLGSRHAFAISCNLVPTGFFPVTVVGSCVSLCLLLMPKVLKLFLNTFVLWSCHCLMLNFGDFIC